MGTARLLDRVRGAIRARHYSRRTEKAYVAWIRRYIFFRSPGGCRRGRATGGPRHEVPERGPGVGLAMGVPGHARPRGPSDRRGPSASPARVRPATRGEVRRASRRNLQAGKLPHIPPLLRHSSAGSQLRHLDGSGASRSQRRQHDTDLHPRSEPGPGRSPKPGGPHPRPMTCPTPGRRRASSGPTRQFRRARTASALWPGRTWCGAAPIRGFGEQAYRASIPQRARRHRVSMVPSNSCCPNHDG